MKSRVTFLLSIAVCSLGLSQEPRIGDNIIVRPDIRVVNGIQVNLFPVHEWYRTKTGDRPMKHWKRFQVFTVKGHVGGFTHFAAQSDDGLFHEILVKNGPPEIVSYFLTLNQQTANIAKLRTEIEQEQAYVSRWDAVTPKAVAGPAYYVDAVSTERGDVNLAKVALRERKAQLAKLDAAHAEWRKLGIEKTVIFVMATGAHYTGMDVWDCGIRR